MKHFIKNFILFLFPIVTIFYAYSTSGLFEIDIPGSEIYISIKKSKRNTPITKLIIGDSTANQLFNNCDDENDIYSLACNQAIGVCGHYFLLNNFLQAGNSPEEVYLIYNALSFNNNLDQIYTYNYFLKPFYKNEYKSLMSLTIQEQIKKIPYYQICQFPPILTSSWSPKYNPIEENRLSPISIEYLEKIDSLSHVYNFKLYIIPSFMSESKHRTVEKMDFCLIKGAKTEQKISIYLDNISYMNDTCFVDGIHLNQPQKYKEAIYKKISDIKKEYIKCGL